MTIGAVFAFFSIVFVTRKKAFISPRWILHGGREIFTFFFLGFLPAFVPLLVVAVGDGTVYEIEIDALALIPIFVLGAVSAYSLWVLATNNLSELAQGGHGPAYLLASHFFEHSLDLIFMYLLLLYLIFP
jgi:hypothetical protein